VDREDFLSRLDDLCANGAATVRWEPSLK
jgi:hypothetical protein